MNVAIISKAAPITVRSSRLSETKAAAGRHGSAVAGIMAIVRHAIAIASATTISSEPLSRDPPEPDFGCAGVRSPTETPSVFETLVFDAGALGVAGAFRTTFLRCTFFIGFAGVRTGDFATGACRTAGAGATGCGVGAGAGLDWGGRSVGAGFGLGFTAGAGWGAGSGAGLV